MAKVKALPGTSTFPTSTRSSSPSKTKDQREDCSGEGSPQVAPTIVPSLEPFKSSTWTSFSARFFILTTLLAPKPENLISLVVAFDEVNDIS